MNNVEIQSALISYLKASTTLTAVVPAAEVRENQWQGTEFTYPNVRVKLVDNRPAETNCDVSNCMFSILIFSQLDSSIQAEQIAGIIDVALHARSFSSSNIRFSLWRMNLIPAIRIDTRTWRSEIQFRGTLTG